MRVYYCEGLRSAFLVAARSRLEAAELLGCGHHEIRSEAEDRAGGYNDIGGDAREMALARPGVVFSRGFGTPWRPAAGDKRSAHPEIPAWRMLLDAADAVADRVRDGLDGALLAAPVSERASINRLILQADDLEAALRELAVRRV